MSDGVIHGPSFRDEMIATMERVRDEKRPGVRYFLIPDFADAIEKLIDTRWTAEEPE